MQCDICMKVVYHDGGRKDAGFKGKSGDCGCRAIAIATGLPYKQVYDMINEAAKSERISKRNRKKSNARTGVFRYAMHKVIEQIGGFKWVPTMKVGQGCKVHLKRSELPGGTLILSLSRHYACVKDGVLYDTYDCSRNETRCVYGYWKKL